jgi:chromosome segregation ATPase
MFSALKTIAALRAKLAQAEAHIAGLESTQQALMDSATRWRDMMRESLDRLQEKRIQLLQAQLDTAALADKVESLQMKLLNRDSLAGIKIPEGM